MPDLDRRSYILITRSDWVLVPESIEGAIDQLSGRLTSAWRAGGKERDWSCNLVGAWEIAFATYEGFDAVGIFPDGRVTVPDSYVLTSLDIQLVEVAVHSRIKSIIAGVDEDQGSGVRPTMGSDYPQ